MEHTSPNNSQSWKLLYKSCGRVNMLS